jgi:hypothetical protein
MPHDRLRHELVSVSPKEPTAGCPLPACMQVGVEDVTAVLSALIEAPVLPAGGAVLEVAGGDSRHHRWAWTKLPSHAR